MGYVQARTIFFSQLHGLTGGLQTGLLAAYHGMQADGRVFAPRLLRLSHVLVDDSGILAVGHQRQGRSSSEDAAQRRIAVHEHVARRGAHEELDAWYAVGRQLREEVGIIVGGTEEERVVDMALLGGQPELLLQRLKRRRLRHAVGHVEIAGDAAGSGSTALGVNVGFFRQSGLTEMHVVIDDAGQNEASRGIDRLVRRCVGMLACGKDGLDVTVLYQDGGFLCFAFVDKRASAYQCSHCAIIVESFCCVSGG